MADVITTLHPEGAPEDNLYPNVKDENIPSNILRKGVLMWQNANPSSTMAEADIFLSESVTNYTEIEVEFKYYYQWTLTQIARVKTGGFDSSSSSNSIILSAVNSQVSEQASRWVTIPSGESNKLHCEHGYKDPGSQDDRFCILVAVYGIK